MEDSRIIEVVIRDHVIRQEVRDGFRAYAQRLGLHWNINAFGELDGAFRRPDADLVVSRQPDPAARAWLALRKADQQTGPFLWFDDAAVGAEAARHLREQGWTNALVVNRSPANQSSSRIQREQAFIDEFARLGGHPMRASMPRCGFRESLEWLRLTILAQPRPLALFAFQDVQAFWLAQALTQLGLAIPADFGLIGCEDTAESAIFDVPISSVRCSWRLLAEKAAQASHVFLQQRAWPELIPVRPLGVAGRVSTQRLGTGDALVERALHTIRRSLPRGLTVAELGRSLDCTPITVQRRFSRQLGRSPHMVIRDFRLDEVERLLLEEEPMTVEQIAKRCGWCDTSHLSLDFRRRHQLSPDCFRRENRSG